MSSTLLLMVASAVFGSSLAIAQSALVSAPETPEKKTPHAIKKYSDRLMAADADSDGALSLAEAEAAGLQRIVNHFDRLDANGDGKVTRNEMRSLLLQRPTT